MPEGMNLSVNGQSQVPPGFRFHPTEEELLHYYLRKKVASEKIDLDVIRDVDLNKLEPWDIQEKCRIGSTPQNDWYFFSHKDKKYPTGTRTNRATVAGFWKATGRDKIIHSSLRRIGMRKTLVFYRGRAPHGQKLDWIMHEYRLDDNTLDYTNVSNGGGEPGQEEGWVVCRVFKKKNYHKALDGPLMNTSTSSTSDPRNDGVLGQILTYMGRSAASCKPENESNGNLQNGLIVPDTFLHLPELMEGRAIDYKPPVHDLLTEMIPYSGNPVHHEPNNDWVALDRLVASQLNGQYSSVNGDRFSNYSDHNQNIGEDFCFSFDDDETAPQLVNMHQNSDRGNDDEHQVSSADTDFWTFARSSSSLLSSSSSDPLSHLSV